MIQIDRIHASIHRALFAALLLSMQPMAAGQDELLVIDGTANLEAIGRVAGMEDVDGDGVRDLVVGVAGKDKCRVHSGATGEILIEVAGHISSGLGGAVADAGHFDGDDVADFAVGATSDDTAAEDRGAVRVFSGATGELLAAVFGEFYEEKLGYCVAGLGDLDLDGYDDIGATSSQHRRVLILGGPDGHVIRHHAMGPSGNTLSRPSIASIGDVDSDGIPDYAVGWPNDSTAGGWSGTVAVFSGRGGTRIREVHGTTANGGGLVGSHLGISVTGVGDIDGDEIPDFAAGAPGQMEYGILPTATQAWVRVYSGADAHELHFWRGDLETTVENGGHFGKLVAGGGDLNGDGVPDVVVGAMNDGGSVRGSVSAFSGRTGERLWRIVGTEIAGKMYRCAIVGDVDHDGLADFAVGDPQVDEGGTQAGRVTVYAGALGDVERQCAPESAAARSGMRIESSGALGLGNNFLTLHASDATPLGLGLLVYGLPSPRLPMAGGWLCTGPPSFLAAPPQDVDATGHVAIQLDFTQPPLSSGPGEILPGSTWSFQLWCRDPDPAGVGPRLSDALAITFPP